MELVVRVLQCFSSKLHRHSGLVIFLAICLFVFGVFYSDRSVNKNVNIVKKGGGDNPSGGGRQQSGVQGQWEQVQPPDRGPAPEDRIHGVDFPPRSGDSPWAINSGDAPQRLQYQPTWESLDTRPIPTWYDEDKLGIFIHWGVFSVPSFSSEWFWHDWKKRDKHHAIQNFLDQNYDKRRSYIDFAPEFTAQFFNASQWADILASSGAKYVVLTSKHHEGYTLWPSKYATRWNAVDVGPLRNVLGELTEAVRTRTSMRMGFYYSLMEWFHPLYLQDRQNNYQTHTYIENIMLPEMYELVNTYLPDIVWGDGEWLDPSSYWHSKEFLAWLFNESPVKDYVVTNDRWGKDARCKHGDYLTCDDRFDPGKPLPRKWENCSTIDKMSWGFVREANLDQYLTIEQIIEILATTVSYNGNLLLNIGPTHEGLIAPIYQERLMQLGQWLKVNGEGIFKTRPWKVARDPADKYIRYTQKTDSMGRTTLYAILLKWPHSTYLTLQVPTPSASTAVWMLGYNQYLYWRRPSGAGGGAWGVSSGISIQLPQLNPKLMPCKWAWVFKIENVQ